VSDDPFASIAQPIDQGGPSRYAKPGPYVTKLDPAQETAFQGWVKQNKIPWQDTPNADYDMRGYWKAQQSGDPHAKRAANLHFPDTWKTPYHKSFSNESMYALPTAPHWEGEGDAAKLVPTVADDPFAAIAQPVDQPAPEESTARKVARGAALGVFEGAGIAPATSPGEVVSGTFKQFGEGIKNLVSKTYRANQGVGDVYGQGPQFAATALDLIPTFIEDTAAALEQGGSGTAEAAMRKDYETAAEKAASTLSSVALLKSANRAGRAGKLETAGALRKSLEKHVQPLIGPREVPIAGEKVPVLAGEAAPESTAGRLAAELKRSGAGEQSFKDFATKQQAAVKDVIRKVAKQTSGMIGPAVEEPGAAMHNAADATFAKAKPMYESLDSALITVPDTMESVSKITQQAIGRAEKLGAKITEGGGESVTIDGRKFTPASDPEAWEHLKSQGLVPDNAGQPLSTYMKVRSELLKMQRASKDGAVRYAIGKELETMNTNMEAALRNTPLLADWNEANRLWAKGYAIRDVAEEIRKSTKGTPSAEQAGEISKVPTEIKGQQLVRRLNELKHDGVLDRAFTPEEVANLRKAADILDRASGRAGRQFGFGYSPHSTIWRNLVKIPAYPLVRAMTTTGGLQALQEAWSATTAGQAQAAINRLARLGGVVGAEEGSQVRSRKDALQLLNQ